MRNKSVREHRIVSSIPTAIRLASDGGVDSVYSVGTTGAVGRVSTATGKLD
jgi:fatty acid/phospholipid biosynthesis enzyme